MTIKTLTTTLLLATSFLLFTACNDNAKTEKNTTTDTNTIIDGSDGNTNTSNGTITGGSGDGDNNATTSPTAALISLTLTIEKTSFNKDENTTVKVMATYSDNTTKDVTEEVEWISSKINVVKVTKYTLTALQDTQTIIQAKLGSTLSDKITLDIYWEVNGHTLPPEPDSQVNNSTLLGIDLNDNGVRDDVERWIYEKYKDKHPIHIDIAMQAGRAYKKVLETPERAKEIYPILDAATWCESYYMIYAKYFNEPLLVKEDVDTKYFRKKIYFNTKERMDTYIQYDTLLSGDTYSTPAVDKNMTSYCDFNTSQYTE